MALVSYILGDCPQCGAKKMYGNVDVYKDHVARGCGSCRYFVRLPLPQVRKKVIYLDQFFFSHVFRGTNDPRFTGAAKRIRQLTAQQVLIAPYSNVHEDETHMWDRYEDLFEFIKATSRGHEFSPAYDVELTQLQNAARAYFKGEDSDYQRRQDDAFHEDFNCWDGYFRIDVGRYMGDRELNRTLKLQAVKGLVDLFPHWKSSTNTFEQDCWLEHNAAVKDLMDSFTVYLRRLAAGDYDALFDSPIKATVIQTLLHYVPKDTPEDQTVKRIVAFLDSEHFQKTPYHDIQARIYAALKMLVKQGAYASRDKALKKLSGFYYDVKHISTYAPYCDAIIVDQAMAEVVGREQVGLAERYGVRVFSLNNWDELLAWFDALEAGITDEHLDGLKMAYP